jgi:uncharacterized protein YfaS (alpha-2-macroglobulin family)
LGAQYSDDTIQSAKLLYGLTKLSKDDAQLTKPLALGLVNDGKTRWYVARSMMWVAAGLQGFSQKYEKVHVAGQANLQTAASGARQSVDWSTTDTSTMKTAWTSETDKVTLTNLGTGQPWLSVQAMTAVPLKEAANQGISLEKEVIDTTHPGAFEVGDLIEVTLKINSAANVSHVAVNDPIPGGSNIVGESYGFAVDSTQKSYKGYQLYFEQLPKGLVTVKYQYQLNNPGHFELAPTRAEALYLPSVFGALPNRALDVK